MNSNAWTLPTPELSRILPRLSRADLEHIVIHYAGTHERGLLMALEGLGILTCTRPAHDVTECPYLHTSGE